MSKEISEWSQQIHQLSDEYEGDNLMLDLSQSSAIELPDDIQLKTKSHSFGVSVFPILFNFINF